jgi:alkane 1-monooxygenase
LQKFKYIGTYLSPLLAIFSFHCSGHLAFTAIFVLYVLIPLLENNLPKNTYNFNKIEKKLAKEDKYYHWVLYLLVPLHLYTGYVFLLTVNNPLLSTPDFIAHVLSMGTVLGVNGINGGHELGHKTGQSF